MKRLITICSIAAIILTTTNLTQATTLNVPSAYPTIQDAIDAAFYGDKVIVADGTYTGFGNRDIDFLGKEITVCSKNGPENCIIDCQGSIGEPHRGFHFHSVETLSSVLDGFTITGGYISSTTLPYPSSAGAIYCDNSSPTIANNIILSNYAANFGAVYCNNNSSPLIISNTIMDNYSSSGGGGICCRGGSSPTIVNNTISENHAGYGAGICVWSSSPTIIGNIISNNSVSQETGHSGGGIAFLFFCSAVIQNNVISGNIADHGGGIVAYKSSGPIITNNTITGNTANLGGGISGEESSLTVLNSILWNDSLYEIYPDDSSTIDITYSDIQGGWLGTGNIHTDPLFVDAADGDYHLQAGSPCIDTGTNTPVGGLSPMDIEGNPRPQDGNGDGFAVADMGAYEACGAVIIEATIDIDPDTLNLSSNSKWITCYIELPKGHDVMDIDGSTVMLNGIAAYTGKEAWARAGANTSNIIDHDEDGIPERMVKFDGPAVQDIVGIGKALLIVTGELIGGPSFEGIDVISVIEN